ASRHPRALHSFPTRRSSDLTPPAVRDRISERWQRRTATGESLLAPPGAAPVRRLRGGSHQYVLRRSEPLSATAGAVACDRAAQRSEEHTSELQSRGHLVCRL